MRNNCGNCIRQGRSRLKHLESHMLCLFEIACIVFIYESISYTWISTHLFM